VILLVHAAVVVMTCSSILLVTLAYGYGDSDLNSMRAVVGSTGMNIAKDCIMTTGLANGYGHFDIVSMAIKKSSTITIMAVPSLESMMDHAKIREEQQQHQLYNMNNESQCDEHRPLEVKHIVYEVVRAL